MRELGPFGLLLLVSGVAACGDTSTDSLTGVWGTSGTIAPDASDGSASWRQ